MMNGAYFTYLLANQDKDAFYAGVTRDLEFAVTTHKQGIADVFTRDLRVNQLVWYQPVSDLLAALRQKSKLRDLPDHAKMLLVEKTNPGWQDLLPQAEVA